MLYAYSLQNMMLDTFSKTNGYIVDGIRETVSKFDSDPS